MRASGMASDTEAAASAAQVAAARGRAIPHCRRNERGGTPDFESKESDGATGLPRTTQDLDTCSSRERGIAARESAVLGSSRPIGHRGVGVARKMHAPGLG